MRDSFRKLDLQGGGLYVHIPFCVRKCRYCAFYSVPLSHQDPETFVDTLLIELKGYETKAITTAYIGGGSPSCLPSSALHRLIEGINRACPNITELTVELNPGQTNRPQLQNLLELGVNRLSFGVQSFNKQELLLLGRSHDAAQAQQAILDAHTVGCSNIGLDLIFAIPGSTRESWKSTLATAMDLDIHHIAAYSLTYEANTPLERMRRQGTVQPVDEDTDRQMYETAMDVLPVAGYPQYEISNFARPGFACRHNLGYWRNAPFLGIGPGAASYWDGIRRQNATDIEYYSRCLRQQQQPWIEQVSPPTADRICETAVLSLRLARGIDSHDFYHQTGADLWETFGSTIEQHQQAGLLHCTEHGIRLTRAARPIADRVLCDFTTV